MPATNMSGMVEDTRFTNSECARVKVVMTRRISSVKGKNTATGTRFPVHSTHWLMKSNATRELKHSEKRLFQLAGGLPRVRFRPKHIHLERLHYVVSAELTLLQSNMTYMNNKRGPQYHWKTELFRLLKLPVFA